MAKRKKRKVIYFAVGGQRSPYSLPWRFWVQGNEAYLMLRTPEHTSKISMHSSGDFLFQTGKLRLRLAGPKQLPDGTTHGPILMFPSYSGTEWPALPDVYQVDEAIRFEMPGTDFMLLVTPMFGRQIPDTSLAQWEKILGSVPLSDGSCCWLHAKLTLLTDEEKKTVQEKKDRAVIRYRTTTQEPVNRRFLRLLEMVTHGHLGVSNILNIPVDPDNIHHDVD